MAYSKRIPPIKIKLNVDEYNKLLEILENMIDSDNENDDAARYHIPAVRFRHPPDNFPLPADPQSSPTHLPYKAES